MCGLVIVDLVAGRLHAIRTRFFSDVCAKARTNNEYDAKGDNWSKAGALASRQCLRATSYVGEAAVLDRTPPQHSVEGPTDLSWAAK